jgi:hypothetical protein
MITKQNFFLLPSLLPHKADCCLVVNLELGAFTKIVAKLSEHSISSKGMLVEVTRMPSDLLQAIKLFDVTIHSFMPCSSCLLGFIISMVEDAVLVPIAYISFITTISFCPLARAELVLEMLPEDLDIWPPSTLEWAIDLTCV